MSQYQCGDLPLRTPTHRRLGGPLPRQPANAPHAHPSPGFFPLAALGCPSDALRGIRRFLPLIPLQRAGCIRVTSPVRRSPAGQKPAAPLPLDLHVLSLSLAFILSQDQTLRCLSCLLFFSDYFG